MIPRFAIFEELQRQITSSDSSHEKTRQKLASAQNELMHSKKETKELKYSMAAADKKIQSNEAIAEKLKKDHGLHISSLENRIMAQSEKIADLEKANRSAQNEKAVLSAAVEARESKLAKMGVRQIHVVWITVLSCSHRSSLAGFYTGNHYPDACQNCTSKCVHVGGGFTTFIHGTCHCGY